MSAVVGMCTRPAIQRAGTETPHLQLVAPISIPIAKRKSESTGNTNFDRNRRTSLRPYV